MWDCKCGTTAIANPDFCPHCFTERKEGEVPRATAAGWSNAAAGEDFLHNPAEDGGVPSAGTSSSTSEEKPELSGSSPQGTDQSTQSPVRSAESPSDKDLPTSQAQSSSASSTDGSTQGTGRARARRQGSSAASRQATQATPDSTEDGDEDDTAE